MSATAGNPNYPGVSITGTAQAGEKPQWTLPYGLTFGGWELVQRYFMRSDTPNGISTDTPPPEANQAFANAVAAGQIIPGNDAAARLVVSIGGIQNGTMSPYGVPWIDGLPGGMSSDQWNALSNRINARVNEAQVSGFLDGVPTLDRERVLAQIASQITQDETARMLAESEISRRQQELDRLERERLDAVRSGDLNRAQELAIHQGNLQRDYAQLNNDMASWLTEQTGQVWMPGQIQRDANGNPVQGTGSPTGTGMTTLSQQQQAFEQATQSAELAANPRTGLQAWMMGQRSGLNGQAPVNQVNPTTTGAFTMPGGTGAFGQAQNATTAAGGLTGSFQVPTTAFQQALMTGQTVPTSGEPMTKGAWWDASNLQQSIDPNKWRAQDYLRGTRDEQAGALGLASFGGFSDKTTEDILRRNLPGFRAPSSSGLA